MKTHGKLVCERWVSRALLRVCWQAHRFWIRENSTNCFRESKVSTGTSRGWTRQLQAVHGARLRMNRSRLDYATKVCQRYAA